MDLSIECTHCRVIMTTWSVPGSPVRYYQCPFCSRTFCSAYREVFRSLAGARRREPAPAAESPSPVPLPTAEEIRWRELKRTADRWFARLEASSSALEPSRATASVGAARSGALRSRR